MSDHKLNIIYMGTPQFAVQPLQALHYAGHRIIAVYTQPPRPAGRGKKLQNSPVHEWARAHELPVYHPENLKKDTAARTAFCDLAQKADLGVVAAYGLILPQAVLDAPRYGCLNIHASLLPRWRGAAPIQYAIWKGDEESGVTIMQMDEGLDTGDMLYKEGCPITRETTAPALHDTLSEIGARLIVRAADDLAAGQMAAPQKQDDAQSSYASMLKKSDGLIDWQNDAEAIDRQVRALNPWPGTYVMKDGSPLKIKGGYPVIGETTDAPVGTLLNKQGDVACGKGTVFRMTVVQPAGKKAMDSAAALNGQYMHIGDNLA